MKFMRFFTRCRLLCNILIGIAAILLVVLLINGVPFFEDIGLNDVNKSDLLFIIGCGILLMLIVIIAVLKCIIKDAEEDLNAVVGMTEKQGNNQ